MKKTWIMILTGILMLSAAVLCRNEVYAEGAFDDYYDYQNPDGTYSYYFTQGVTLTMSEEWYKATMVIPGESGASFYHKASYEKFQEDGYEGGWLFTLAASVNHDFEELPHFQYIGFDEKEAMNYFAILPSDVQAYVEDEAIGKEYMALYAEVEDILESAEIEGVENGGNEGAEKEDLDNEENDDNDENDDNAGLEDGEDDMGKNGSADNGSGDNTAAFGAGGFSTGGMAAPQLSGGWQATKYSAISEESGAVLDKALESLTGAEYEPVALLATQVVAGKNYCFLCRKTPTTPSAGPSYAYVYVYEDLEGNATILEIQDIVFGLRAE